MIRTKRESLELFIKEQRIGPGGCKGLYSLKSGSSVSEETDFSGEVVSTTPVTLNRLIKEIVVHERIDEDKTRHISIEIHFNLKPIPEVEQVTA